MKRFITLLAVLVLSLSLTACITINVTPQEESSSQPVENSQVENKNDESVPVQDLPDSQPVSQPESQPESQSQETVKPTPTPTAKPTPTPTPTPTPAATPQVMETDYAMYDVWAQVVCWWNAAEGRFALPDMADSHTAIFAYGMWDTEFYKEGIVKYMYQDGEYNITAFVDFDGVEETVIIDYSGKERDGKIQISINGEQMQYMFSGYTKDIAYMTYLDNING